MTTRNEEMRDQVKAFNKAHPEVWVLFKEFTFNRIGCGFTHYSSKAIFERVRWETDVLADAKAFKLNNNYPAFYARAFMKMYPEHEGFFRTRHQTSKDNPLTGLPELKPADYDGDRA